MQSRILPFHYCHCFCLRHFDAWEIHERRRASDVTNVCDLLTIPTSIRNLHSSELELPRKLPPTFWISTPSSSHILRTRHGVRDLSGFPLLSLRLSYFSLSLVSSCLALHRYSYNQRSSNLLLSRSTSFPFANSFALLVSKFRDSFTV